jgi:hypothetical protein
MSVAELPLRERLRAAASEEYLLEPINKQIGFLVPLSMSLGLRQCAIANEIGLSALARLLIRQGARHYGIDLSASTL